MAGPAGPAGHHDELRATLASRGLCWGHLVCYRDLPGSPFTEGHAALMRRVAPMLGAHMRAGWRLEDAGLGGGGEPGTLVLDAGLALLSATRAALGWLEALGWPPSAGVPPFVYALAARAADIRSGVTLRIRALQGGWAKLYETDWRKLLDGFGSGVDWPVCTYPLDLRHDAALAPWQLDGIESGRFCRCRSRRLRYSLLSALPDLSPFRWVAGKACPGSLVMWSSSR